jgi:tetrahydromethanopterin S-methyltransferase subunit G
VSCLLSAIAELELVTGWSRHDNAVHLRVVEAIEYGRGPKRLGSLDKRLEFRRLELKNRDGAIARDRFAEVVEKKAETDFADEKFGPVS